MNELKIFSEVIMRYAIIILSILIISCAEDKDICGKKFETKGLFTTSEKDENIIYEMSTGNVLWGIGLIETVIAPVYLWGFSIYEPIELKKNKTCCDVIKCDNDK